MKKLLFIISMLLLVDFTVSAQKKIKTYQPVYIINSETAKRVALEQQLNIKTSVVQVFLIEYPVLEDLKNFDSKKKYGLINDALIDVVAPSNNKKWTLYYLKNNKVYKVKNKRRTARLL